MDISKPQRCWVHVEQVGDELVLRWRAKWFAAPGWFAFFLLSTALCVFPIVDATRKPTLGDILFNIFFINGQKGARRAGLFCIFVASVRHGDHWNDTEVDTMPHRWSADTDFRLWELDVLDRDCAACGR